MYLEEMEQSVPSLFRYAEKEVKRIKVELEDRVWEVCRLVRGIREICFVLETPEVPDIPAEIFPVLELACDKVVSLLTETTTTQKK